MMKAILTYHSIDDSQSVISTGRDSFRRQIEWLCSAGVPVRSLRDLVDPRCAEGVALTFDDGFENFASDAWPVLREHDLPATVFIVSQWVGMDNGWDANNAGIPRLPLMGWSTLADLRTRGVELGGHSRTHCDLRGLSTATLESEIVRGRVEISHETGAMPAYFAYPSGLYDAPAVEAVGRAGYELAVTTAMGLLDRAVARPLELPRVDAFYLRRAGAIERWGTIGFERFVRLRARARKIRRAFDRTRLSR